MTGILRQSTQVIVRIGPFMDVTDAATPETGITLGAADQAEALKAAGAATADISGNTWAAITGAGGWYDLTLTTTDTNTVGDLTIVVQDTSVCLPVFARFQVIEEAIYDAMYAASANAFAGAAGSTTLGAGAITATVIATGAIDADAIADNAIDAGAIASDAIAAAKIASGAITAAKFAAGAIDATAIANGAIDAATFAAGAIDAAALAADAVAEIADAVWDEDATGHQTGGTFGQAIGDPGADTNTIFKAVVTDATGATVGVDVAAVLADTGTDGVVVASINANAITATAIANAAIDAATFAAGAIDAAALAADAGTEIATAVWASGTRSITGLTSAALADFFDTDSGTTFASAVAGSVVKEIVDNAGGGSAPTAAEVADAVWDEDATGHQTQGSFGQVLGDSGATATSVWGRVTTALPNATAGAAGGVFIAGTNAPVTITGSGNALTVSSTGGNGSGIVVSGNGTGDGVYINSGSSSGGHGVYVVGKTTGVKVYSYSRGLSIFGEVNAMYLDSDTGNALNVHAADGDGIYVLSDSAGDSGLNIKSGAVNGRAISLRATGVGTGIGLYIDAEAAAIQAGAYGAGGKAVSLYSSGEGIVISALNGDAIHVESKGGNGDGISVTGHGSGTGMRIAGGATGYGIDISSNTVGVQIYADQSGLLISGGYVGAGVYSVTDGPAVLLQAYGNGDGVSISGSGSGAGIDVTGGATNGDGIVITGQGSGADIRADITGSLSGTIGGLTVAAVKDFFDTDSGTTFASAVAGSVVKEIADNAGGSSLTLGDIADAVMDEAADGATTLRQSIRLWNAALGGKASGLGTTTAVFRDLADTKDRITATVDSNGNRAAVTRDLT